MAGGAEEILTVLSNFWFLVPAGEAIYMRRWTRFMIYLLIIVNSSMYHACSGFANACAFDAITHRHLDFFFAQLIIPLTALYVIDFPEKWAFLERILIIAFAFVIFVTQVLWGESNAIQIILAAVSLLMILVYWAIYALTRFAKKPSRGCRLPPYDWEMFALGIGCTALACNLYATQMQYHLLYWSTHSCWHSVAAFGQYFILMIWLQRKKGAELKSLDAAIKFFRVKWKHVAPKSRV